jgi:hypothetical protein
MSESSQKRTRTQFEGERIILFVFTFAELDIT